MSTKKLTKEEVLGKLKNELGIKNVESLPRMKKIVLNMGLKDALKDQKILEEAVSQMALIVGQKPIKTQAKKAIAGFKLRKGDLIGAKVTLRGKRMNDFFEKLVRIVLPRVKDFHGVPISSFDGHGNYTLGLSEISVFPEVDTAKSLRSFGLEITINTTAKNNEQGRKLLEVLGMPFKKYG